MKYGKRPFNPTIPSFQTSIPISSENTTSSPSSILLQLKQALNTTSSQSEESNHLPDLLIQALQSESPTQLRSFLRNELATTSALSTLTQQLSEKQLNQIISLFGSTHSIDFPKLIQETLSILTKKTISASLTSNACESFSHGHSMLCSRKPTNNPIPLVTTTHRSYC